jgi:protein-S-isoprenylcysteine O-methyltransferase Ste14
MINNMKTKKDKISIMGIGMQLAILTLIYSLLISLFNAHTKNDFSIKIIPNTFLTMIGIILLFIGIPFLIISVITMSKAYKVDYLCITGVYSMCRHPLYSSWIIFIIPGITLFFNSWLLLTIPVIMFLIFKILIKREESFLQNKFGEPYIDYKNKVSLLFPMFWRYKRND